MKLPRLITTFLASRMLCSPLEAIYTLFIFIAAKELNASLLQIALLASSKPVSALLAYFCSAVVSRKPQHVKTYLIMVNGLAALPALAFPFVDNCWFYVGAHLIFMTGQRAIFPAWNMVLKNSMTFEAMSKLQAKGISIQQAVMIFSPLLFGYWIDHSKELWKTLFFLLGVLQLCSSCMMLRLTITHVETLYTPIPMLQAHFRNSLNLLREQKDFVQYLCLFFLGGAGLVMMQSTLPLFFKNDLHLSYTTITLAVSGCKGLALISSAKLWAHWVNKVSLYRFNFYINIFSVLFIASVLLSNSNMEWLFIAYLFYGTMQAGCEMSWNMSGPFFAKEQECSLHSSLNLPFIGVRGLIFPFVGQSLFYYSSANIVFICAGILCLASVAYAHYLDEKYSAEPLTAKL